MRSLTAFVLTLAFATTLATVFVTMPVTHAAMALDVPPLRGRVTDQAGVLEVSDRLSLERKLRAYEERTGHQYAVLIVPSLQDESIDDYAIRVAEQWRLGKEKTDDGVLLLIAMAERKMRIEVGYGLEGPITDALSSQIIRNVLQPAFRAQDFAGGIDKALDVLMQAGSGEALDPRAIAEPQPEKPTHPLVPLFFLLLFFVLFGGRGAGLMFGSMLGSSMWSSRRGGGGFSGGGGRFGGGGASGGW